MTPPSDIANKHSSSSGWSTILFPPHEGVNEERFRSLRRGSVSDAISLKYFNVIIAVRRKTGRMKAELARFQLTLQSLLAEE